MHSTADGRFTDCSEADFETDEAMACLYDRVGYSGFIIRYRAFKGKDPSETFIDELVVIGDRFWRNRLARWGLSVLDLGARLVAFLFWVAILACFAGLVIWFWEVLGRPFV